MRRTCVSPRIAGLKGGLTPCSDPPRIADFAFMQLVESSSSAWRPGVGGSINWDENQVVQASVISFSVGKDVTGLLA